MNPFESPEPIEEEIDVAESIFGIILFSTMFFVLLWVQLRNTLSPAARGFDPKTLEIETQKEIRWQLNE
jgi:hypothetical protein